MKTVKELLESLKKKISFTYGGGDYEEYDYTPEEHAAILSLLSQQQQQAVESDEEAALKAYPVSMGSFVFNKGSDDEIVQKFDENEDFREGFVAGCQHVRQPAGSFGQLSQQQQQREELIRDAMTYMYNWICHMDETELAYAENAPDNIIKEYLHK